MDATSPVKSRSLYTMLGTLLGLIAGVISLYALDYSGEKVGFAAGPQITGAFLGVPVWTMINIAAALLGASVGGVLGLLIDSWIEKRQPKEYHIMPFQSETPSS